MEGFSNVLGNVVNSLIFWKNFEQMTIYIIIASGIGLFVLYQMIKKAEKTRITRTIRRR